MCQVDGRLEGKSPECKDGEGGEEEAAQSDGTRWEKEEKDEEKKKDERPKGRYLCKERATAAPSQHVPRRRAMARAVLVQHILLSCLEIKDVRVM